MKASQSARVILKTLGVASVVATAVVAPNAAVALTPLLRRRARLSQSDVRQGLSYAKTKHWVSIRETGLGLELALSDRGKARWLSVELEKPLFDKKWDGWWRIVVFDVPSSKRVARDALRSSLKKLGFQQLQESVWLSPYRCNAALEALRRLYGLGPFVCLIEARRFDNDYQFKELFGLGTD